MLGIEDTVYNPNTQLQGQHELHNEILSQKKQTKQTNSAITLSVEQEQTKHFSSLVSIVKNTAFQMLAEISSECFNPRVPGKANR